MRLGITALTLTIALVPSVYAQTTDTMPMNDPLDKIQFDLDQLDEQGLYGPEDGKRSLSYEFCVPYNQASIATVQAIDPTLILYLQSPGRVGCGQGEMLAIGHTHQPNYRQVLTNLANLDAIERIEQFWGE